MRPALLWKQNQQHNTKLHYRPLSLMNTDMEFYIKILTNQIQYRIKNVMWCKQAEFILEMQGQISENHKSHKYYMLWSSKILWSSQLMQKNMFSNSKSFHDKKKSQEIREEYFKITKAIYERPTGNIGKAANILAQILAQIWNKTRLFSFASLIHCIMKVLGGGKRSDIRIGKKK